jgi:hypothetical protein
MVEKYLAKHDMMVLDHPTYSLYLSLSNFFLFPQLITAFKGACELRGSHSKSNRSTEGGIKKWFPGMLPKALQTLAKVCYCPRELL